MVPNSSPGTRGEARRLVARGLAFVLAILAVGALGVGLGRSVLPDLVGGSRRESGKLVRTGLLIGQRFPAVTLVSASGDTFATKEVLERSGRIVLFVDPQCPSCSLAARKWQRLLDSGVLEPDAVLGVTSGSLEESEPYRTAHGFSFPIYRDAFDRLRRDFGVRAIPYEVVVGRSGRIRSTNAFTDAPVHLGTVRGQLAQ